MMDDETHSWTVLSLQGAPDPELLRDLKDLAAAAAESDGNPPFSEQTLIELNSPGAASVTVYAVYGNGDNTPNAQPGTSALEANRASANDADESTASANGAEDTASASDAEDADDDTASANDAEDADDDTASANDAGSVPVDLAGAAVVVFLATDSTDSTDSTDDTDSSNATATSVAEIVVRPSYRNQGVGRSIVAQMAADGGLAGLSAWSHGNHAAAAQLAAGFGFAPVRELWRMRQSRSAHEAAPAPAEAAPSLPDGVVLRSFRQGRDEQAWLDANAAAFAHHPEQGRTTLADLQARMAEEWFDPAGFLLAVRDNPGAKDDGELLGFHWTKVHPAAGDHPAIGEVYVVGVTPKAQGLGLGKALTLAGIEHLHSAGLQALMLYVDADNEAAVALYRKLGFTRWDVDVMYAADPQRSGL